jgi:hypothetical protein
LILEAAPARHEAYREMDADNENQQNVGQRHVAVQLSDDFLKHYGGKIKSLEEQFPKSTNSF